MLTRIVKMVFDPGEVDNFLELFEKNRSRISGFEGCDSVILLRDIHQNNIFFTYSHWRDEEALEAYRKSDTFREIWGKAKPLFIGRAEAWSVEEL